MNHFAAFLILYQISFQDFLDCAPETRIEQFGGHVGVQRMVKRTIYLSDLMYLTTVVQTIFNEVIAHRLQTMNCSVSSDDGPSVIRWEY
jgi:hypothetical protein